LIDKLIAESKLRKYEKKQLKQETNELTEKLDKDWKELMPVVPTKNCGEIDNEDEPPTKKKIDKNSYDILMRSLKFDRRGMVKLFKFNFNSLNQLYLNLFCVFVYLVG